MKKSLCPMVSFTPCVIVEIEYFSVITIGVGRVVGNGLELRGTSSSDWLLDDFSDASAGLELGCRADIELQLAEVLEALATAVTFVVSL